MELSLNRKSFIDSLSCCCVVCGRSKTLPILDNVLFECRNGVLVLRSSDGDVFIERIIDSVFPPMDFCYCVNGRDLLKLLKSFSDEEFVLSFRDNGLCIIGYVGGEFELPYIDGSDFPYALRDMGNEHSVSLSSSVLLGMLSSARPFVSTDSLRPVLCGIYFYVLGNEFGVCSTDGRGLYHSYLSQGAFDFDLSCIISSSSLDAFLSLLSATDSSCRVVLSERTLTIFLDSYGSVSARLVDGRYPNFRSVIPSSSPIKCSVNRKSLLGAISRASLCASAVSSCIVLDITNASMTVSSTDLDFRRKSTQNLECCANAPIRLGVSANVLKSCLEAHSTDTVDLCLIAPDRAIKIESDGLTTLAMPLKID